MSNIRVYKPTKFMLAQTMKADGMRILDFGCGPGVISMLLAQRASEVVGVDHWAERIESAKKLASAQNISNVRFECLDARNVDAIKALGRFDIVICWGVLHRITDQVSLLHLLGGLAPMLCLEWHAPLFPLSSTLRLGYFPRSLDLDRMNITANEDVKVQGDSKFWCPSIGSVEEVLRQISFTDTQLIGIGERLRGNLGGMLVAALGSLKRLISGKRSSALVPVARVYVVYSRDGCRVGFDRVKDWTTDKLPHWVLEQRDH